MTTFWSFTLVFVGFILPNTQYPEQPKSTDKNKEYVCVQWSGSSDFSQNQPSICLKWELKDKPWFRKT